MPCLEQADDRPAGPFAAQRDLGHEDVIRPILIEHDAPPAASRPCGLAEIEQHPVRAGAACADIVDRAVAGTIARPRVSPSGLALEPGRAAATDFDRNRQHRCRACRANGNAEDCTRLRATEQHTQAGDIPIRADLFVLDHDSRHDAVERAVGQRSSGHTHPLREHRPALALRDPPAGIARGIGRFAGDIDLDAADVETAGTVGRREPLVGIIDLRDHQPAGRSERQRSGEFESTGKAAD